MRILRRLKPFALMAFLALVMIPGPINSQSRPDGDPEKRKGPGTEWRLCRIDAHYDMAMCYHDVRDYKGAYMMCNLAWELDLLGCDVALITRLCPFDWCQKKT